MRALQPASSQSVALCSSKTAGKLASTVSSRLAALWPAESSAIVAADDFSKSPVCLRPDRSEAITQTATLWSLLKSVVARSLSVGNQGQNELINGQRKKTAAFGLLVDQCDSRLNPDTFEFRPKRCQSKST